MHINAQTIFVVDTAKIIKVTRFTRARFCRALLKCRGVFMMHLLVVSKSVCIINAIVCRKTRLSVGYVLPESLDYWLGTIEY